ncbi:MAG: hypothetical protein JW934_12910 [Anaerolineae bacterium]|nr:hypothetical protein [Anaerolineae bacterium]
MRAIVHSQGRGTPAACPQKIFSALSPTQSVGERKKYVPLIRRLSQPGSGLHRAFWAAA